MKTSSTTVRSTLARLSALTIAFAALPSASAQTIVDCAATAKPTPVCANPDNPLECMVLGFVGKPVLDPRGLDHQGAERFAKTLRASLALAKREQWWSTSLQQHAAENFQGLVVEAFLVGSDAFSVKFAKAFEHLIGGAAAAAAARGHQLGESVDFQVTERGAFLVGKPRACQ